MTSDNAFPYLGNFSDILDMEGILSYAQSLPDSDWGKMCSPLHSSTYETRPPEEKAHIKYYGLHNAEFSHLVVTDKGYFPDEWFTIVGAKKEGHVAKIFYTDPGNFEPPHRDFYPSFLTRAKPDGSIWSQEEITEMGKKIIRIWMPLTDSKLGHILYSEDYALAKWKQGDAFQLPSGGTHGFVNGGRERRYLLVFTSWTE